MTEATEPTAAIGAYDEATRTVAVAFSHPSLTKPFARPVNACLGADGAYDAAATADRVADVGRGVAAKIALGLISDETIAQADAAAKAAPADDPAGEEAPGAAPANAPAAAS